MRILRYAGTVPVQQSQIAHFVYRKKHDGSFAYNILHKKRFFRQ